MTGPFIGVVLSLLIAFPLVHAQAAATQVAATPTGCPASVGVENGNFGSGQFAPWQTPSRSIINPTISIVSPGYNSAHALQLEFPAANVTSWFFLQDIGLQCEGAQYFTSFAVNWLNFSIQGDPDTNWCNLDVGSSYCFEPYPGIYNATNTPGWQYHSFICTARKTGYATLVIDVGCEATYDIPAFTWQLTDFDIHLVRNSTSSHSTPSQSTPPPTPPPSKSKPWSAPSSYSNFTSSATTTPSAPTTSSTTLSATTSPTNVLTTNIPTSSTTATNIAASSTTVTIIAASSTNVLTSSTTVPTGLTSPSILTAANKACQARETGFLLGRMGLVLLLPYVVY
ncbi:hypothetical protein L207DRAFT_514472 [Hyaloscypha variabilis F]|uniref:Uncharacterized protein n=1 Tax=Hyaloscypha variabilis (strain UAMH 11265 / GT02V1 / F) TaxID=1149755 RepID=A0A2J6RF62_HYAVF|nr:hypothetical protein L207DRAFT_514472 [Hyaloscypha variabilis F]